MKNSSGISDDKNNINNNSKFDNSSINDNIITILTILIIFVTTSTHVSQEIYKAFSFALALLQS